MDETFTALYAEVLARLNAATPEDVQQAGRLCMRMPAPTLETQQRIDHAIFATAFALEQNREFDLALNFYRRIFACESADPGYRANANVRLGIIHEVYLGNPQESIEAYRRSLSFGAPPLIARTAHEQLSGLLLLHERYPEALPHLEAVLAGPELPPERRLFFWFQYIFCQLKTGDFGSALEDLLPNLPAPGGAVAPLIVAVWTKTALELELANHLEIAREFYVRLLDMQGVPGLVRTNCYYRLGLLCENLARWDESLRYYRDAVQAPGEFPQAQAEARFRLAELLYLYEDFEGALEQFTPILAAPQLNAMQRLQAQLHCGVCLLRIGRLAEAERAFVACRAQAGDSGTGFDVKCDLHLAELFEMKKDFRSARECYSRVIQNPYSEPLTKAAALTRLRQLR